MKVNDYFHRFYPDDASNREPEWCSDTVGQRYRGKASTIFPLMVLRDGLKLSVQAHFGAYSYPRDDFADEYQQVEIMGPDIPELVEHGKCPVGDQFIYSYVPVTVVDSLIEARGGIVVEEDVE